MTQASRFERFSDDARLIVSWVGQHFQDPDDDWHAVMLVEQSQGGVDLVEFTDAEFDGNISVWRWANEHLPSVLEALGGRRVALVTTVYRDGCEHVAVHVLDGRQAELWLAPVERSVDAAPKLGQWITHSVEVVDLIMRPLQRVLAQQIDEHA
jgi:hypothetical protein